MMDAARVQQLVELGRWTDAGALLAPLLAADPDNADLHELDAAVHDGLGEPAAALESAGRAVALAPHRAGPHRAMAHAHRELGQPEAAYRSAREAQRLAPHDWAAHATAAMMAVDSPGCVDQARTAAERALALSPDEASAHFAAGYVAQGRGRRREAQRHYRCALALDPSHAPALNNLTMLTGRGRPGRALLGYTEALRADPQGAVPLANLTAMTVQLLKRVFVVGAVAVLAGALLTGLGTSPVNRGSTVAGGVLAVVAAVLVLAFLVGCSPPVRLALRHQLGRMWEFWTVLAATVAMVAFGLSVCWVDGVAHAVCRHGLVLWLLLVLPLRVRLKGWWRRRRAGRA